MAKKKLDHTELENLLESTNFSVVQERNDFLLPQIVDFVKRDQWINTRPEYQRRLVWDVKKKSRLIESLFMNVPVPPIFLYEHDLNRYEVMDGQQRLNTIIDFYENKFPLRGLEYWTALNGYSYANMPERVQRGLDRRRITATVLLADRSSPDEMAELRKQVFDRLNTGGKQLVPQELRNCLYSGQFNDLIVALAGDSLFNDMWGIPRYKDNVREGNITDKLSKNTLFKRMTDVEIVLRYFAFSAKKSKIRGAVKKILDETMIENVDTDINKLKSQEDAFLRDLNIAFDIFGVEAFRIPEGKDGLGPHSQSYYDSIMVSLSRTVDHHPKFRKSAKKLKVAIRGLVTKDEESRALFVGRANTAKAVVDRLDLMEKAFLSAVS